MEKYWNLNLWNVKLESSYRSEIKNYDLPIIIQVRGHMLYNVNNYIKTDTFVDNVPPNYMKERILNKYIIPSEVMITFDSDTVESNDELGIVFRSIEKYTMKFSVDEEKNLLVPVEIINFKRYWVSDCFYSDRVGKLRHKTKIIEIYTQDKCKYYRRFKYGKETKIIDLEGREAREKIEYNVIRDHSKNVTPASIQDESSEICCY